MKFGLDRRLLALMIAHCAGMLDLVALPVWVGTLVQRYQFDPQQAGGLATLFLIGASIASIVSASRFHPGRARMATILGFGTAAMAFALASVYANFMALAGLHLVGGMAAGTALSFAHGTIGRTGNPHRTFALAGLALGVFGILLLGATPGLVDRYGGPALFRIFAVIMGGASLAMVALFPAAAGNTADLRQISGRPKPALGSAIWFAVVAIALLAMTQAMTLSFYERVGMARGFGRGLVTLALVIYGFVNLLPAPLAAVLERRVPATTVICIVPAFQAVFAMIITHTSNYFLFASGGSMMAFTIIFTHTFAFGLLSRMDPTGRAVAGTPAMLMVGSAIAPFLGGTLVKYSGFEAIGYAAIVLVTLELLLFWRVRHIVLQSRERAPAEPFAVAD